MAHFTLVELKDLYSRQFLETRGFSCRPHCGQKSYWSLGGVCYLYIDVDAEVRNDHDLIGLLVAQYFNEGRERGKQDALELIHQRLAECVFQKSKSDEPTCEVCSSGGLYGTGKFGEISIIS